MSIPLPPDLSGLCLAPNNTPRGSIDITSEKRPPCESTCNKKTGDPCTLCTRLDDALKARTVETPSVMSADAKDAGSFKTASDDGNDLLSDVDPVLNQKMKLVNDAIDQIGFTNYHGKLFCLNGFGYSVDSQIVLIQSVVAAPAFREFGEQGFRYTLNNSLYIGLLIGALFWGFSADAIGRKIAFNVTLLGCAVCCCTAGVMPNWELLATAVAFIGFTIGGNLVLDVTVFLEYLPSNKQWVLTSLACWWGLGQAVTGLFSWLFLAPERFNCADVNDCPARSNLGWRLVFLCNGGLVLVLSLLRVFAFRLDETPKYLVAQGQDEEVVKTLTGVANKYNRECSLTLEDLQACGEINKENTGSKFSLRELSMHLKGIFANKTMAWSTVLLILKWGIIGLAYPLFYVFLPNYLKARGASLERTPSEVWANYAITNVVAVPGPLVAGFLCNTKLFGRRYTMALSAALSMLFLFGYIFLVKTPQAETGFSCATGFAINMYYAVLFAYTPEVLPSAHRATGNGIVVGLNRIMGIVSSMVAAAGDSAGSAPLYVCASLFGALVVLSCLLPFEPYGHRSS